MALVTGGNRGLGRTMALALQAAGATVVVTGRDRRRNAAVATDLIDGSAAVHEVDVRDESAVARTVAAIVARLGRLDILINNAGIVEDGLTIDIRREDWEAVIETDLTGPFLCARQTARAMIARGAGGKIINFGSIYSLLGTPRYASYAAAKAGLLGLTRGMAIELAPHSIQVNAILPGWFETAMTTDMNSDRRREIIDRTPAGRWGRPEDIGGIAIFLAARPPTTSPAHPWSSTAGSASHRGRSTCEARGGRRQHKRERNLLSLCDDHLAAHVG